MQKHSKILYFKEKAMKVIYNKFIPIKGFVAINLFGVVFARKEHKPLSIMAINHEDIHTAQMKELLYIGFYLWYAIEWLFLLIKHRNAKTAYRNIRFEKEANTKESDFYYLYRRKLYAWINY